MYWSKTCPYIRPKVHHSAYCHQILVHYGKTSWQIRTFLLKRASLLVTIATVSYQTYVKMCPRDMRKAFRPSAAYIRYKRSSSATSIITMLLLLKEMNLKIRFFFKFEKAH